MSNLEREPREVRCAGGGGEESELLEGRMVPLGGPRAMAVSRTLPGVRRRMIGAWCFVDAYGPEEAAMRVPPHPHTGLQTVSWLLAGRVLHRDSLGSLQEIRRSSTGCCCSTGPSSRCAPALCSTCRPAATACASAVRGGCCSSAASRSARRS